MLQARMNRTHIEIASGGPTRRGIPAPLVSPEHEHEHEHDHDHDSDA